MTPIEPHLLEQLCAWMDGELPPDEARFLQRRLEADPALRAQWERWQLASACVRGQPVRLMPATMAENVARAIALAPPRPARWPWVASAAAAVLVAVLLPRMLAEDAGRAAPVDEASLATAEPARPIFEAATAGPRAPVSPVDPTPSVRDFPLAQEPGRKPWPRSPLLPDDRSMQAYLVRHNAMMAEDGFGGFMPYVDVVANGSEPTVDAEAGNPTR